MTFRSIFSLFFISLLFVEMVHSQSDPEAVRIIRQAEDQVRGNSSLGTFTMTIERPDYTRNITMKSWALGDDYGLTLITAPARDRGTAFLKRGREVWNWQPSIDRVIKMPPSMMSQGWMGSDLTTDDLIRQTSIINDYVHKLLPEEILDGITCHVIELIPNEEAAVVWGKIKMWISKDDYLQYKSEFFDEDMKVVNTILGSVPRQVGKRKLLTRLEVLPSDKLGNKTIMTYQEIEFDIPIKEEFFSLQNLRRIQG